MKEATQISVKPIKVTFIITGLSTGGAETMLLKLLQHIDRERFLPVVISLSDKGTIGPKIEAQGIPVHSLGMRSSLPNPFLILKLIRLIKSLSPVIVHTWMYHADLLGGLAARLAGCRNVIWCIRHSNLSKKENKTTTLFTAKICALLSPRIPAKILSCSSKALTVHSALGYQSAKMAVIPNGFELDKFRPDTDARQRIRQQLDIPIDFLVVGLVARFDPQKNHLGFVECAAMVSERLANVRFVLAGLGVDDQNQPLLAKIEGYGLREKFRLLGRHDDIPSLMTALDVLVSSSSHGEAFPNVLGEAMACQVPCVVTDVGDSAEIVGEAGWVVAPNDMSGLAGAVVAALELSPSMRAEYGVRARERVKERYDIRHVSTQYEAFYHDLASSLKV